MSEKRKDIEKYTEESVVEADQNVPIQQDGDDQEEQEIVDVDFDFYDPTEIDFHAIKNLLRQLLDSDCDSFELSTFADIILDSTSSRGTTVKVDGEETDPYALLSIVDLNKHKEKPAMKTLMEYLISKTSKKPEFNRKLRQLLASSSKSKIGLVFSERMINMPVEIMPPMYKLTTSTENENACQFDYYLVISKAFTEEESQLDLEDKRPAKRGKFQNPKETYLFHTEDEVFHEFAEYKAYYEFSKSAQDSDSRRTFQDYGIFPKGHVYLLKGENMQPAIKALEQKFPSPGGAQQ